MAIYFEPYIQRKRSEEIDKERYYDQKALAFEAGSRIGGDIANVMFAYNEKHRADMHEKFQALQTMIGMFGADKLPQSALDAYGASIDGMAGSAVYPRGPDGHALPPPPSTEQMTRNYLQGLPKEELQKRLDVLAGFSKPDDPTKAADMQARRHHEEVVEGYAAMRTKNAADASWARVEAIKETGKARVDAAAARGAARDPNRPSNMVIDDETKMPRFAREGEAQLTQQQYDNWLKTSKLTNDVAIKKTALKKEIEYLRDKIRKDNSPQGMAAKQIISQGMRYTNSKDPKFQKAGKLMLSDAYGKYGQGEGLSTVTKEALAEALDTKNKSWRDYLPDLDWTRGGDSKPVEAAPNPTDLRSDEERFLQERGF